MTKELFLSSEAIKDRIYNHFSKVGLKVHEGLSPFISFTPIHDSWKPIELWDDGEELTVHFGEFTHSHFGNYDDTLSVEEAETAIVDSVIKILDEVFRDELEFHSGKLGGGYSPRSTPSSLLGKIFSEQTRYVWSGPVESK